jgi:nitrogenase molybdenum-iron protein alpha/beta subunit
MFKSEMKMFYKSGRILYENYTNDIVCVSDTSEYHVYYYECDREDDFFIMKSKTRQEMKDLFRELPDEIEKILLLP